LAPRATASRLEEVTQAENILVNKVSWKVNKIANRKIIAEFDFV
jgi:hypothetical protein